jgi:hypothetical protein
MQHLCTFMMAAQYAYIQRPLPVWHRHAAEAIGMTRRMIAYYKNGSRPIPKTVWLACLGYEVLERHAD